MVVFSDRTTHSQTPQTTTSTMNFKTLTFDHAASVATIRLNRPDAFNALNVQLLDELHEALDAIEARDEVRALLLSGNGRAFCSGADLNGVGGNGSVPLQDIAGLEDAERHKTLDRLGTGVRDALLQQHHPLIARLQALPIPSVCAVNGVAAGGGVGLALACDIVVAARSANFMQVFVPKLGLVPDCGSTWFLTQALGPARARALCLLGEPLSAVQAAEWGLIWSVVEDEHLQESALGIAQRLAANPRLATQLSKQAIQHAQQQTLVDQLNEEAELQGRCGASPDFVEGVTAFQHKRSPRFE